MSVERYLRLIAGFFVMLSVALWRGDLSVGFCQGETAIASL